MGDALHGPQSNLARFWHGGHHLHTPIGAGLLLHHAKMRRDGTDLGKMSAPVPVLCGVLLMVQGRAIGEIWIGIVHHKIQALFRHPMGIEISKYSVGSDKISLFHIPAENVALHLGKPAHTI